MLTPYREEMGPECREFLAGQAGANYCHDPAWAAVIAETYGKRTDAWVWRPDGEGRIQGFVQASGLHLPGSRKLVSLPYLDYGGPIARTPEIAAELVRGLIAAAKAMRARLQIRSLESVPGLSPVANEKAAMLLPLDGDREAYWKKLDAKVRNQVRKAEKSGVTVKWGREENLDDFYRVFCANMRDLGSPTHSRRLFAGILRHFPGSMIGLAMRNQACIGGLFRIHWKDTLAIPWASTLREERQHCPNNALYWEAIAHAFDSGCKAVDFGRSSKHEGTYRFKRQWLAEEFPLHWYPFDAEGKQLPVVEHIGSGGLGWAPAVWSKLPLAAANLAGPLLRGHIPA